MGANCIFVSMWPQAFIDGMRQRLGADADAFFEALEAEPETSVRLNVAKPSGAFSAAEQVPWCPDGRYLAERPSFTLDPLLHAGAYYVQEASSMAIWQAVAQGVEDRSALRALDVCAAPGGKSTLLASLVGSDGLLVANEVIGSRSTILRENLTKWGAANVVVTNNDPRDLYAYDGFFDVVLVDAPCSGEGLFRRDARAVSEWSPDNVALCCGRQKRILTDVMGAVCDGGLLIYSTCTWEESENEEIAAWLAEQGFEPVALEMPGEFGLVPTSGGGFRCYPHKVRGEGFYLLAMRRVGEGVGTDVLPKKRKKLQRCTGAVASEAKRFLAEPDAFELYQREDEVYAFPRLVAASMLGMVDRLKVKKAGILMGKVVRDGLIPAHELALSTAIADAVPGMELSLEDALTYLRKDHLSVSVANGQTGWLLARYQGLALGWVKALPNRLNNYYPKEWRVRMR